ncbi:hypothetical protein ASPZODRAFT_78015 [Penicilliopsis zonata CBS 506.65]|uniref:DUF6590 domain-containing protein n=1 Tax=Penicilliopsis zonata CBS 506.65 TaxID=1073090 RepID=A0A1L9S4B6_9EURO|nr:hypothetical protein ASPZODRAFT_78015 [Penicilliopsis zonata CBS 506.65]OJJ42012.1 hypothetical protein ASPZODRAFT_78015 [Penicilliopsis zonata CBS 506.65]
MGFVNIWQVFAFFWHKNSSQNSHGNIAQADSFVSYGLYGQQIYSSIRRMVVFKERNGFCLCLPISTYSKQGVAKKGVDPSKHSIIYMEGTLPERGPNEPPMVKDPIAVIPATSEIKLDRMSRLNFEIIHTVEHNQRVMAIGKIADASMPKFINYAKYELGL